MDFSDIPQGAQGKYNQAFFLQLRLHELWLTIDRMSTNLLNFNDLVGLYNYEVVFNNLCTILRMVKPYMHQQDKESVETQRLNIRNSLITKPIYTFKVNNGKKFKEFNRMNWYQLQELIYQFELKIEELAFKHGLGNPMKSDPSRALID